MTLHDRLDWRAIGLLVVVCASWGLQQTAVKLSMDAVPPLIQASVRSLVAFVLVWIWMAVRRVPLFERDGTFWPGIGAGLLFGGEFLLIYWGLTFTGASRAIVFLYLSPFVVAIGVYLFVPGEFLKRGQVAGLVLAFVGILTAFGENASSSDALSSDDTFLGDIMLVGAAVLWGATTVLIKASRLATASAGKTLFYQLGVSAVMLPIGALALGEVWTGSLPPLALGSLVFQGIWIAFVTYLMWFWLVRHYPAARLTSFTFLTPLFGVLAGVAILGETVTPAFLVALGLVGTGIYLVNRR